MKILSIAHSYVVRLNRRLCRELASAEGVSVTAAAPASYPGDLRPIPLEPLGPEEGFRLAPIEVRLGKSPHLFHYRWSSLRRVVREGGFDLIHVWEEPFTFAGAQIAAAAPRTAKLVFSTFQNINKRYPPPFSWCERYSLSRASGWTAFGETIAETMLARPGYAGLPHATIPLGVDLEVFKPDRPAGAGVLERIGWSSEGPPVIGYLGRFIPPKGIPLLLEALDRLPEGSYRALFVGGGPLLELLEERRRRKPAFYRVLTDVAHDAVPAHLNAMDILAAPSRTTPKWREQLGRMLLEAMACGVPMIVSDSGEIPRVVGPAALVTPEAEVDQWAAGLGRLVAEPELRSQLAARGLNRVRELFDWKKVGVQFHDFFRSISQK